MGVVVAVVLVSVLDATRDNSILVLKMLNFVFSIPISDVVTVCVTRENTAELWCFFGGEVPFVFARRFETMWRIYANVINEKDCLSLVWQRQDHLHNIAVCLIVSKVAVARYVRSTRKAQLAEVLENA